MNKEIPFSEIGSFVPIDNGKGYVIHAAAGCPRNACIEVFEGMLRCCACYRPVAAEAQNLLDINATHNKEMNHFVWKRPQF